MEHYLQIMQFFFGCSAMFCVTILANPRRVEYTELVRIWSARNQIVDTHLFQVVRGLPGLELVLPLNSTFAGVQPLPARS